jgi:universal stress protein E
VLHVYEFQSTPYTSQVPASTFQERIEQIRTKLDEQIRRVVRGNVKLASTEVMIYTAHKAILERALRLEADLIVIGRHRPANVAEAFLGTTSEHVVRGATVPCLIIDQSLTLPLDRVLVPIDLSDPALHALEVALQWIDTLGSKDSAPEIIVLHVIPRIYDFADVPFDSASVSARLHEQLEAARERVGAPTTLQMREEVRWADEPVAEILDFIKKEDVDLAVLGTHGYGAIRRAVLGSVASGVARSAACPLILVPPALWRDEDG